MDINKILKLEEKKKTPAAWDHILKKLDKKKFTI